MAEQGRDRGFAGTAAPRPDVPERLERVVPQMQLVPEPARQGERAEKVTALAPERFALQLTIGEESQHGLIHHEPGHDEHIHVRFQCPPGDRECR